MAVARVIGDWADDENRSRQGMLRLQDHHEHYETCYRPGLKSRTTGATGLLHLVRENTSRGPSFVHLDPMTLSNHDEPMTIHSLIRSSFFNCHWWCGDLADGPPTINKEP